MKRDLLTREDIQLLVDSFYEQVRLDDRIAHFFSTVVTVNWATHLPKMYSFWEQIIFHRGVYKGNPMAVHHQVHTQYPMTTEDFERWLALFKGNADALFEGPNTELAKQRAESIALSLKLKLVFGMGRLQPGA